MHKPQNVQKPNNDSAICAVVITHNPDEKFSELLNSLHSQVAQIIIVDNGTQVSSKAVFEGVEQQPGISMIENSENLGVATALNQGLNEAREQGFEWMVTFDQDSQPELDFVEQLVSVLKICKEQNNVAIIAPQIIDAKLQKQALFLRRRLGFIYERVRCKDTRLEDVTYVITSGAMVNTRIGEDIGGFRADFFIDYVDTEFCLRANLQGYRILVACEAKLHHHFGDRKHFRWGPIDFFPSFHSPERWYTMSRNRIPMMLTYGLKFPHWLTYDIVATVYILVRMLLTENQRGAKFLQFIRGTWDGLCGRMGPPYWVNEKRS